LLRINCRSEVTVSGVVELVHPLVSHHLTILRDKRTPPSLFRQQTHRLAALLAVEATADLPLRPKTIETPLTTMLGGELAPKISLVPILRAGLGMIEPLQELLPEAAVWHLGMYRDEQTAQPVEYYSKLATGGASEVAFVVDPMLATGGSVILAIEALQRWGCPDIRVLSIIASRPGVDRLMQNCPNVKAFVCAIDPELNEHKFIVPGLGDAGDRIFNTLPPHS
jgi:uracil phosphoribosyltransferase